MMGRFFLGIIIVSIALILAMYLHVVSLSLWYFVDVWLFESVGPLTFARHACSTLATLLIPGPARVVFGHPADTKANGAVGINHAAMACLRRQ